MIHDQSSTGSTLFIEPMAVVNLNNEYKELQLREQEEIEVILAGLSNLTASYATQLLADYELLTELDFIFARAAFAQTYNGVAPLFNDDGGFTSARDATHYSIRKRLFRSTYGSARISAC